MSSITSYEPRSIKRRRRTKAEIAEIEQAIYRIVEADHPMTCRQTFYQATVKGLAEKREAEYKQTICRLLARMRRKGVLPFRWIADNTRWMRGPRVFGGIESAIEQTAAAYRRDLWANQDCYVEVWCEKDALAGVMMDSTWKYGVPLMVAKGFSSITFLHSAAEKIAAVGKPTHIYYFGDHDPSGKCISSKIESDLRTFSNGAEIYFTRAAVTEEQIVEMGLPTRPTKKTDSRAKTFKGDSVELDAIPAHELRRLVTACIEGHLDQRRLELTKQIEAEERQAIRVFADRFREGGGA